MWHKTWEECLNSTEFAPDYKVTNIDVYDQKGHNVSISKVQYCFINFLLTHSRVPNSHPGMAINRKRGEIFLPGCLLETGRLLNFS